MPAENACVEKFNGSAAVTALEALDAFLSSETAPADSMGLTDLISL